MTHKYLLITGTLRFGFSAFLVAVFFPAPAVMSQQPGFIRSELPTVLETPWEITYGPDDHLWITERGGRVSRVDPVSGSKKVIHTATDYWGGSVQERLNTCFQPWIGTGTLGLALHPDFPDPGAEFVYFVYSYNGGTANAPATRFKIVRLAWDPQSEIVTGSTDLVTGLPTGYDHLGGRLLAVNQGGVPYIYLSIGDHGVSETNQPTCYSPQSANPNNFAQFPDSLNGKIHRFAIDGSIPVDNPLPGNSLYTRGHRNPQGLMFNPKHEIVYTVEHGDRTDDEVNVLYKGKNYGWKDVRGYHADNNYPGESAFVSSYSAYPGIADDGLVEPLYSFCAETPPSTDQYLDWCTVAPSDGTYYGTSTIPGWENSLLLVTLKDGEVTDRAVYVLRLGPNGTSLATATPDQPNPALFFAEDQNLNGRLRDIAVSADGSTLFLINNGGTDRDKITVYQFDSTSTGLDRENPAERDSDLSVYPNPVQHTLYLNLEKRVAEMEIWNVLGQSFGIFDGEAGFIDVRDLPTGVYVMRVRKEDKIAESVRFVKI